MPDHLYMPDDTDPWYGLFSDSALHQRTLASQLFDAFEFTYVHVFLGGVHLWVVDVSLGVEIEWGVCPVLENVPGVGAVLHLRGVSEEPELRPGVLEWIAGQRKEFGESLASKLRIPVIVADELHHVGDVCELGAEASTSSRVVVEMVPTRTVPLAWVAIVSALTPGLSREEEPGYALALRAHLDGGGSWAAFAEQRGKGSVHPCPPAAGGR
mgnify:CR=1 FL=1